jgi:hypothetical protein
MALLQRNSKISSLQIHISAKFPKVIIEANSIESGNTNGTILGIEKAEFNNHY